MDSNNDTAAQWFVAIVAFWGVGWLAWALGTQGPRLFLSLPFDQETLGIGWPRDASLFTLTTTRLCHLAAVVLLFGSAAVIGSCLLRVLRLWDRLSMSGFLLVIVKLLRLKDLWDRLSMSGFLLAIIAGMVVLSNGIVLLGVLGFLQAWLLWAVVLLPLVAGIGCPWKLFKTSRLELSWRAWPRLGGMEWILIGLATIAVMINYIGACSPPHEYDTLKYQMLAPKEHLEHGRIAFLPHNFFANLPSLMQPLYVWGMAIGSNGREEVLLAGGDGMPHLINWIVGLLTALAVFSLARTCLDVRKSVWAACLFYLASSQFFFSTFATVDLAVAFFVTVAVAEGWRAVETPNSRRAILCGIATGAALSAKYHAVLILLLPLVLTMLVASPLFILREKRRSTARHMARIEWRRRSPNPAMRMRSLRRSARMESPMCM